MPAPGRPHVPTRSSRRLVPHDVRLVGGDPKDRARLRQCFIEGSREGVLEGTTTFTLTVFDRGGRLLRSALIRDRPLIGVDGSAYRLGKVAYDMRKLTLTFEPEPVHIERQYDKPMKANRDAMTRAQFIGKMMREPKNAAIKFRCPEEKIRQPIAGAGDAG